MRCGSEAVMASFIAVRFFDPGDDAPEHPPSASGVQS